MKKIIASVLLLAIVLSSVSAFAQRDRDHRNNNNGRGSVILRDGRTIVRIDVGEENDREMALRIRRLEQAVRDLQAQVYDLRDTEPRTRVVTTHICSMTTTFDGTFVGKATSKIEATAITRQKCEQADASFCSSNTVTCEQIQEQVAY